MGRSHWTVNACRVVHYCSKISLVFPGLTDVQECQMDDWKARHAKERKRLQRLLNPHEASTPGVMKLVNLLSGETWPFAGGSFRRCYRTLDSLNSVRYNGRILLDIQTYFSRRENISDR